MLDQSLDEAAGAGIDSFERMNLIERLIEPAEATDAVVWLASTGAPMVTGVALPIDGGLLESREWP